MKKPEPTNQPRDYIVTFPDGHEEAIHGLLPFCIRLGLNQGSMVSVARGRGHSHLGFRVRYAVDPFPEMAGPHHPLRYWVTHPDGREEMVKGLKDFCEKHGLDRGRMTDTARGKKALHRGYRCRYAEHDSHGAAPPAPMQPFEFKPCCGCGRSFKVVSRNTKYCPDCREQRSERPRRRRVPLRWVVTHPDGRNETVTSLHGFCQEHGLQANNMYLVARGKRATHKGFRCRYRDLESETK